MTRLLLFAAAFFSLPAVAQSSFINEIHYDNTSGDVNEGIEVVTPTGTDVSGWTVVLYNGLNGESYDTEPLGTASATNQGGKDIYNIQIAGIQNGSPDGVALVDDSGVVIQFLSYEGQVVATNGPANGQTSEDIGVVEGSTTQPNESLQLSGSGSDYSDFTWQPPANATFGAPNNGQVFTGGGGDPTVTQQPDDVAGYRLLSVPVQNYTVGDLAGLNLVQGVAGQYPNGEDNVFIDYAPTTNDANDDTYVPAASTADALEPGRGFFWYLFDNDVVPDPNSFGGGTSRSYDLASRPFSATGPTLESDVSRTFAQSANGFYMIGNPFAQTFETDNLSYTGTGTLATTLQAWDPTAATYQPITIAAGTYLAVWQGVFAEVSGASGAAQFDFVYDAADAGNTATFYGRRAASVLKLALDGRLDSGVDVHDRAAWIDLSSGGTAGWDRRDASKLTPPTADFVLIAPVGTRDGAAHRQAVLSTGGIESGTAEVPLALRSTGTGTFTITPSGLSSLPDGTTATLVDRVANTSTSLVEGQPVTFSASAGDWAERFEIQFSSASTLGETGPEGIEIGSVRPNPSSGPARLIVRTAGAEVMTATVFDALGRQVAVAFDGVATGETTVSIPSDLAPGVYVVRVQGASFGESRQFVVTR